MDYYVMYKCNFTAGEALLRRGVCQVTSILLIFM